LILAVKAFWIALCVAALAMRPVYAFLLSLKSKQVISEFVPEGHQVKVGTPNMGGWIPVLGMLFMLAYFATLPVSAQMDTVAVKGNDVLLTLVSTKVVYGIMSVLVLYAVLGFADDYLVPKLVPGKRGIDWLPKLGLQVLFALPAAWLSTFSLFEAGLTLFLILFFANAFNFADGLDALAGSMLVGICIGLFALGAIGSSGIVMVVSCGLVGGIIPFLLLNAPPARVFMGDTGSLPIGALLGVCFSKLLMIGQSPSIINFWNGLNLNLWYGALLLLAGMMIAELVPVPIQILSVKLFKRRVFPFTPIHHAFEEAGWKETRVVWTFALMQLLLTAGALTLALLGAGVSIAPSQ
jgi:phospho-N-acetylmuramoyl-pentapeptide-transferase